MLIDGTDINLFIDVRLSEQGSPLTNHAISVVMLSPER